MHHLKVVTVLWSWQKANNDLRRFIISAKHNGKEDVWRTSIKLKKNKKKQTIKATYVHVGSRVFTMCVILIIVKSVINRNRV